MTKTYPKHELSDVKPRFETQREYLNHRKSVEAEDIRLKKQENENKVLNIKSTTFKDYYQPCDYVQSPRYTSVK